VPNDERSRDNSFLDRERRRWKGIALIVTLGILTLTLVIVAILS